MVKVKICGITTKEAIIAAEQADYIGFVFYPSSSRNLTPHAASSLQKHIVSAKTVAVTVNPDDVFLDQLFAEFKPDFLQLHGEEMPERVTEIKRKFAIPIIKAFSIKAEKDFEKVHLYSHVADYYLFDAKAEQGLPGGNGVSFDWNLLKNRQFDREWFLSGGISIENVQKALQQSGATMLDVSSGVETSPGIKSSEKIQQFLNEIPCKQL